jgi:RHS repeat-associated protein
MLKGSIVVVVVLVSMVAGTSTFSDIEGKNEFSHEQVLYQIPQRGVQDFSDGDITFEDTPIEIVPDEEGYTVSGAYYTCSITKELSGVFLKIQVGDAWIAYELPEEQPFGKIQDVKGSPDEKESKDAHSPKCFEYKEITDDINLRYTFSPHEVLEEFVLQKFRDIHVIQKFSMQNVWYSVGKEGISFYHVETGRKVFFIPAPVMYEEGDTRIQNYNIHYEVKKTGDTYFIEKIIDKEGLDWLKSPERVYPVIVDSTTQGGFSDPWEESGLVPYGQYFKNVNEYVSPSSGGLTVQQTDLTLPGRGMDLTVTRIYTTPQLFSLDPQDPQEFTPTEKGSPWRIANGWQLDFPVITDDYLYLWGGRMYKIEWEDDPPGCTHLCFPPLQPEEQVFNNHKGDHFRLIKHVDETYTLYLKDGRVLQFSSWGLLQSITDTHGNVINFSVTAQSDPDDNIIITSATITDTIGRVVTVSPSGVSYGGHSVNYTIQYVQNSQGESEPLLVRVTDCLGRMTDYAYEYGEPTGYENRYLLTKVTYPTGGHTDYTYGRKEVRFCKDSCGIWNEDCHEVIDCYNKFYQFLVITQKVYADTLTRVRTFSYTGDWEDITGSVEKTKDGNEYIQSTTSFSVWEGKVTARVLKDYSGTQLERIDYVYDAQGNTTLTTYYKGTAVSPTYRECCSYDEWGNQIYARNSLGYEMFSSYCNTSSEGIFKDYSGNVVLLFSNSFFSDTIEERYDRVAATCTIKDGSTVESYYSYSDGSNTESKDIYEGKSYQVYRGTFDEGGQTSFPVSLDTLPTGNVYLRIYSLPTRNAIQKTETHSVSLHTWYHNSGYWQNPYFYAHWQRYGDQGYDPVGPFVHYPGTSGYVNYTLWMEGRVQYVKTTYNTYQNKLPAACSYKLNSGSWTQITSDLQDDCAQITIPQQNFSLENTLQFSESSSYTTRFSWALYVPVDSTPEVYEKSFAYDTYGNMTSATNDYGTVHFVYGPEYNAAYMTEIIDPLQNTISAVYDDLGNITSITDARGYTYQYEYDLLGRLLKKINPDLTEREAVYDDGNNMATIYDEKDTFVKKYFDGLGRPIKTENALYMETYTYNYQDNLETKTDPLGLVYTYEYDVLGRISKTHNPDGTQTQCTYNNNTNTVEITDENLHSKEYQYDWADNLLSVKEHTGQNYYLTEYGYDEFGNVNKMKDARGNETLYDYGLFGIERVLYPDGTEETMSYDSIGNLIQRTAGEREIHYQYNSASQLVTVTYPDSSVVFSYDANGNRTSMEDAVSSTVYSYDSRNRLTSETKTIDGVDYTTSYTYDEVSNVTSITYSDGTVVTQTYDNLNRLQSVDGYAQFTWNADSQIQQISYQNDVTTTYVYDLRGRPEQMTTSKDGNDLMNLTYNYDATGNILHMKNEDSSSIKEEWNYTYDPLDRLLTAAGGPPGETYSLSYQYDSTGNRTQLNSTIYTYNEMNELLSLSDPGGNSTFTYDIYGNLVSKDDGQNLWEYSYDCEDRLLSVKKDGQVTEEYFYDGDGKRIKKVDADSDRVYIYGGLNVLFEVNTTTQMEAVYIYGPTGQLAKKVNDITEYYHTDHLGSTRLVTSENSVTTEEIMYKPFGEQLNETDERYTYNGKELDETGLYYYGARYYNPVIGRFISRDPLTGKKESPQTLNRYAYCLNNPQRYIDPAGEGIRDTVINTFKLLESLEPEDLEEVQAFLDAGDELKALKMIFELLGFDVTENADGKTLSLNLGEGKQFTVNIDNNLIDPDTGQPAWGLTDNENFTISINLATKKAGDATLTVLHEICHGLLGNTDPDIIEVEHQFIYPVELAFMNAMISSSNIEFSRKFQNHILGQARARKRRVPIFDVLNRWKRGWRIT